jgi:hypothetical protein
MFFAGSKRYTSAMLRLLHQLAAFFFYILGLTFFAAYLLLRHGLGGMWPAWWLQVADLPLALCAILYGGMSMHASLAGVKHPRVLAGIISIPLIAVFLLLLFVNFFVK